MVTWLCDLENEIPLVNNKMSIGFLAVLTTNIASKSLHFCKLT